MQIPGKTERTYSPNAEDVSQLLGMLQLGEADLLLHDSYRQLVEPVVDDVVDDFYDYMLVHDDYRKILVDRGYQLEALKMTQKDYLLGLGRAFNTAEYFESRIVIGRVHERVGVSLSVYQCAVRYLQHRLLDCICDGISDREQQRGLLEWLLKVIALDTALVIEAYHGDKLDDLRLGLEHMTRISHGLKKRVDTDPLTQTVSRQTLTEVAVEMLGQSDGPVCFAMLDIDFFKRVNDAWGHQAGDVVLAEVAARVVSMLRDTDLVGRFGGEEFLLVLEGAELENAAHVCERVRRHIAESPVATDNADIEVTVSLGLVQARIGETLDEIIRRADMCLYQAKDSGRNMLVTE